MLMRRFVLGSVAVVAVGAFATSNAEAGKKGPPEAITKLSDSSSLTVWRVDRPTITVGEKEYPQIAFQPGDRVTIQAGGCARRGGYPPPNGSAVPYVTGENLQSGENIYAGTIYIPGVVKLKVKEPIARYIGTHDVPWSTNEPKMFLRLGYHDNEYGDNNYNDIDDIDSGPCRGLGYAWVRLDIHHGAVPKTGGGGDSSGGTKPMDLVWDHEDDNGLPLNPAWKYEKDHPGQHPDPIQLCDIRQPGLTKCTSQPVTEDSTPNVYVNAGCNIVGATFSDQNAGHRNWGPTTFTGSVVLNAGYSRYAGASAAAGWDADMDLLMTPSSKTGLVASSMTDKGGAFSMEFDGEEVMFDHSGSSFWWSRLDAVENDDRAKAMFNPGGWWLGDQYHVDASRVYDDSVVVGLLGLDCRHDCFAELHPVYAMAAHLDATSPSDDQWAVFARNWGNEGSCGAQDHQVELSTVTMRIPRKGATGVQVTPKTQFLANKGGIGWNFSTTIHNAGTDNAYALLTLSLPQPDAKGIILGELHLAWSGNLRAPSTMPPRSTNLRNEEDDRPTRGDKETEAAIAKLSPAEQQVYRAPLPRAPQSVLAVKPDPHVAPAPQHKKPWELHRVVSNQSRINEVNSKAHSVCATIGNKLQAHRNTCKGAVVTPNPPPDVKHQRGAM